MRGLWILFLVMVIMWWVGCGQVSGGLLFGVGCWKAMVFVGSCKSGGDEVSTNTVDVTSHGDCRGFHCRWWIEWWYQR